MLPSNRILLRDPRLVVRRFRVICSIFSLSEIFSRNLSYGIVVPPEEGGRGNEAKPEQHSYVICLADYYSSSKSS